MNLFMTMAGNGGYQIYTKNLLVGLARTVSDFDKRATLIPVDSHSTEGITHPMIKEMINRYASGKAVIRKGTSFTIQHFSRFPFFCGEKRIGYSFWEGQTIPKEYLSHVTGLDELITSSPFYQRRFNEQLKGAVKCDNVLYGMVDTQIYFPFAHKKDFSEKDEIIFLTVGKFEERKASLEMVVAFLSFFENHPLRDKVWLKCKFTTNTRARSVRDIKSILEPSFKKYPRAASRVLLIDEVEVSLPSLYNNADVFLFPSKAEGVGLPLLEALACGTLCITAPYTSLTDYANKENSFLLDDLGQTRIEDPFYGINKDTYGEVGLVTVDSLKKAFSEVLSSSPQERARKREAAVESMKPFTCEAQALRFWSFYGED